jgi:hypothetical protein
MSGKNYIKSKLINFLDLIKYSYFILINLWIFSFGHIHFSSREETGKFYFGMINKTHVGPKNKNIKFTRAKYYKNSSNTGYVSVSFYSEFITFSLLLT